jgi:hypothetical protein
MVGTRNFLFFNLSLSILIFDYVLEVKSVSIVTVVAD